MTAAMVRSARLTYRGLTADDLHDLHALVSDWEVVQQLGGFPWPADPAFTATRARPYGGNGFVWGCFLNGAFIGTMAVTDGILGYSFSRAHWGQGYATEAGRLAVQTAFDNPDLTALRADYWSDNPRSAHVLKKLGFAVVAQTVEMSKARGVPTPSTETRLTRARYDALRTDAR